MAARAHEQLSIQDSNSKIQKAKSKIPNPNPKIQNPKSSRPCFQRVRTQHFDVVRPLESGGVGHGALAHAALHLVDGLVFVFFHPFQKFGLHGRQVADAVPEQCRGHHGHARSGHHRLQHVQAGVHAAGDRQVGLDLPVKNRHPVEAQQQFVRRAQDEVGNNFQVFQVEVRLIEAVEQNQGIRARLVQALGRVGQRAEVGADFYGHGNADAGFHLRDQVNVHLFHLAAAHFGVGGNEIDIQFQGIGAGFLDLLCVPHPAARGSAVQAADDGDLHGLLGATQVLEIAVGAQVVPRHVGDVRQRFRKAFRSLPQEVIQRVAFHLDLLLEQGGKHDGGGSGVFHAPDIANIFRKRRSGNNERVLQGQTQVFRSQVNHLLYLLRSAVHRHGGQVLVVPPAVVDVFLRELQQTLGGFRIAVGEHGVTGFVVDVFLQRQRRRPRIQLHGILAQLRQVWIIAVQRPVAGLHRGFLLIHPVHQVIAVGDAVAVSDDDGRPVVGVGFQERLQGLHIARTHGDLRHINVAVADGHHAQVFLAPRLSPAANLATAPRGVALTSARRCWSKPRYRGPGR